LRFDAGEGDVATDGPWLNAQAFGAYGHAPAPVAPTSPLCPRGRGRVFQDVQRPALAISAHSREVSGRVPGAMSRSWEPLPAVVPTTRVKSGRFGHGNSIHTGFQPRSPFLSSFGNRAMLMAIRRAWSVVRIFAYFANNVCGQLAAAMPDASLDRERLLIRLFYRWENEIYGEP
jgi:hypothetical protein